VLPGQDAHKEQRKHRASREGGTWYYLPTVSGTICHEACPGNHCTIFFLWEEAYNSKGARTAAASTPIGPRARL
jgi:hypothetical protein